MSVKVETLSHLYYDGLHFFL